MDVVRAVLRVVVLDEEARAAHGVVVAVARLLRTRPGARGRPNPAAIRSTPLPRPPAAPDRRSGGSAVREVARRGRVAVPDPDRDRADRARRACSVRMSAGARSSTIATRRSSGVNPASKVLASVSSPVSARNPAAQSGRRVGSRNDGVLPMTCPSASVTWTATWCPPTRHDHGARASGSPKPQTSTTRDPAASSRRVRRVRALEDRFEAHDRADLAFGPLAQRRPEDRVAAHWSGLMSRSASPWVPGVYAQERSFVSNGKTAAARWVASSPSSQARAAAVISSAAAVTATPAGCVQAVEDQPRHAFDGRPLLRHRVPVADRDRAVLERLDVDGDAPWRRSRPGGGTACRSRPCRRRRPSCGAAGRP